MSGVEPEKVKEVLPAHNPEDGVDGVKEDCQDARIIDLFRQDKHQARRDVDEQLKNQTVDIQDLKNEDNALDEKLFQSVLMDTKLAYPRHRPGRGYCLIIENRRFDPNLNLDARNGSERDSEQLIRVFNGLQFKVVHLIDRSASQIITALERISFIEEGEIDVLVVCVLTHGDEGIFYASDRQYRITEVWEPFTAAKCPQLAGRPKLFFFQACQGTQTDSGGPKIQRTGRTVTDSMASYRVPKFSDFLLAHSSVNGYYSWRNKINGSWFIQVLCYALKANHDRHDLASIITKVCQVVAQNYESNSSDPRFSKKKQIPYFYSTLIAEVNLTPRD